MFNLMRALRWRHPQNPAQVQYVQGRIFTNGAMTLGYESRYTQSPVLIYRGAGRTAGSLRPLQHPQVYYSQAVPFSGVGGLTAGQILGYSLTNADTTPVE